MIELSLSECGQAVIAEDKARKATTAATIMRA